MDLWFVHMKVDIEIPPKKQNVLMVWKPYNLQIDGKT